MDSPYECDEGITDPFATRHFYELCQAYRHTPLHELELIIIRFEALKDFGRAAVAREPAPMVKEKA